MSDSESETSWGIDSDFEKDEPFALSPSLIEQIRNNIFPHTEVDLRVRSYLHLSLVVDIVLVRWPRSSLALS